VSDWDGPSQLARAAEMRDRPFQPPARQPQQRTGPMIPIVWPDGVVGKARIGEHGDTASARRRGSTAKVTLLVRWIAPPRRVTAADLAASVASIDAARAALDAAIAERDDIIRAGVADGWTLAALGDQLGLTRQRVGQIAST